MTPITRAAAQEFCLSHGADPTRHALPARFVSEELGDAREGVQQVGGFVEHHDHAGAERGVGGAGAFERQRHVQRVGPNEGAGGAAKQHRLQRAASLDATGQLDGMRATSARTRSRKGRAGPRAQTGRTAAFPWIRQCRWWPTSAPPSIRMSSTLTRVSTLFTTVGLPKRPTLRREWRFRPRLAALALNRVEERRLLTADVGPAAAADLDVEGMPAPATSGPNSPAARACVDRVPIAAPPRGYSPRM